MFKVVEIAPDESGASATGLLAARGSPSRSLSTLGWAQVRSRSGPAYVQT